MIVCHKVIIPGSANALVTPEHCNGNNVLSYVESNMANSPTQVWKQRRRVSLALPALTCVYRVGQQDVKLILQVKKKQPGAAANPLEAPCSTLRMRMCGTDFTSARKRRTIKQVGDQTCQEIACNTYAVSLAYSTGQGLACARQKSSERKAADCVWPRSRGNAGVKKANPAKHSSQADPESMWKCSRAEVESL